MRIYIYICLMIIIIVIMALPCMAQLNPFETGGAEAPIVEASPSGGISPSPFVGRTRDAAEAAGMRGAVSAEGYPMEAPPGMMDPEMMMMRGMAAPRAQQQIQLPTPTPIVRMIRVVTGRRVHCAVCNRLLEDVRFEEVPETMRDEFYDDGTHGDEVANDGTYTNIEVVDNVIGPECVELEIKLINLLVSSEDKGPLGFFRLFALTDEDVSLVPQRILVEEDLDTKLQSWASVFLRMFRKNKDDIYSEFYSLYVPPPPQKPKLPMPPGFNPPERERLEAEQEQQRGAFMGEGIMGEPMGGASGRYYDESMMMR